MLLIKTKHKILIAYLIQLPISILFKIFKISNKFHINRNGINWFVDINEGIDFKIFLTGKFEIEIDNFLKKNISENDIILDIGANIGALTLPMAKYVGDNGFVHAFEPTKYAYEKLKKNVQLNNTLSRKIKLNQILLTDKKNKKIVSALYSSWPLDLRQQEHKKHGGNLRSTEGCKSVTLDQYIFDKKIINVKFVKIDVDGFEIEVLKGGKQFFKKQKPIILIELAPYTFKERGKRFSTLIHILKDMGYELFEIKNNKKLPLDSKLIENMNPDGASLNVVGKYINHVNN